MKKILIVEDEESILELQAILLSNLGFVKGATSGPAAIQALAEDPPDLVVLDIGLPGVDGFGILKHIKSSPTLQNIPIVIVSCKTELKDKNKAMQLGADWYITKPFNSFSLFSTIKRFLPE